MRETRGRSITVRPLSRGDVTLPPDLPVDPYRHGLYSVDELYDADEYAATYDARAFAWALEPPGHVDTLARALHDHAVDEALTAWLGGRRLVGVMGGHSVARGDAAYTEAARFAHAVGDRVTVATGGGPGAMEAANLGAYLARQPAWAVDRAVELLAAAPSYQPSVDAWVGAARRVREEFADGADSLGIPTWFYGHEPSNLFATSIAKYFRNALREAILLQVCDAGIVFLPGTAGTVQEIFQDGCENYYADESAVAPMVLVGATYWTETVPAWPLVRALARGRPMEEHVHLVDSVAEAADLVAPMAPEPSVS